MQRNNPLGPSFWIIPVPSDDDALLTRTFPKSPDLAKTLEEQSVPNPCADKLQEKRESQMQNHYEDAIDTKTSAHAGGLLALYGFGGEAAMATHLLYKVNTTNKVTRLDTAEYLQCCREKACGWGYVASLVRGDGEYASATEASAQVKANYSVISGGVSHGYSVTNKRAIKGYIAAIIVAHARGDDAQKCPPGHTWAKIECVSQEKIAEQEELCKKGNPKAADPASKDNAQLQGMFKQQQADACRWLELHGGPTTTVPAPPAPPPSAPPVLSAKPAAPAAPTFEPGNYAAINSFWSGTIAFSADGTFRRDNGAKGVWIFDGGELSLKWADGTHDELKPSASGAYKNMTGFFTLKRTGPLSSAPAPAPSAPSPSPSAPPRSSRARPASSGSSAPASSPPVPAPPAPSSPSAPTAAPPSTSPAPAPSGSSAPAPGRKPRAR